MASDMAQSRINQAEGLFSLIETRMGSVLTLIDGSPPQIQAEGPYPFSLELIHSVEDLKEELWFVANAYAKLREFQQAKQRGQT